MAKAKNSFEAMAQKASKRLDEVRAAGQQLTFLPDEDGSAVDLVEDRAPGRPKGAKGKVSNQMRDWLAAQGFAMPEDVLAKMAGLDQAEDPVLGTMAQAELVLAWAFDGATKKKKGGGTEPQMPTAGARMSMFAQLYTIRLRATDALLPYGAPKATPDVVQQQVVQVVVPAGPSGGDQGAQARDITPKTSSRMVPADVGHEMQQKQGLSETQSQKSDDESRTE